MRPVDQSADFGAGATGPAADFTPHANLKKWAAFDPPLRDRSAGGCCMRNVSCKECGVVLGSTDDPVDAFLIALRHRRDIRRKTRRIIRP
jgi:hypothetical protein